MDTTTFLAQLWGPVLLALSFGMFLSKPYYQKIYRDLEKEVLAVILFGMTIMGVGIAQLIFHHAWATLPEILISLLGWGMLLKGMVFVIAPGIVDKKGDWVADLNLIPYAAVMGLLIGGYLTWFAYIV